MVSCTQPQLIDYWAEGSFFDGVICAFTHSGVVSELLLGSMVFSTIAFGFYVYSGSVILPVVLLVLLSGIASTFLVGPQLGVAIGAVMLTLTAAGILFYRRFL